MKRLGLVIVALVVAAAGAFLFLHRRASPPVTHRPPTARVLDTPKKVVRPPALAKPSPRPAKCGTPTRAIEAEAVKVAEAGWRTADAHDQAVALGILARADGPCEAPRIAQGLSAAAPELRVEAVLVAAETGVEQKVAAREAHTLLDQTNGYVRAKAALALLRLGDPAGVKTLVQLARWGRKDAKGEPTAGFAVASYAAMRLQAAAGRAGRGALLDVVGGVPDIDLMARAGLVRLGDHAELEHIRSACEHGSATATMLLGEVGAAGDVPRLTKALAGPPDQHRAAMQALAALGHTQPLEAAMKGVDLDRPSHDSLSLLATASRARAVTVLPRFVGLLSHGPIALRLYAAQLVVQGLHPGMP